MGRHRGHARTGDIGTALRELGYTRVRCWRRNPEHSEAAFSAKWYHAETFNK